MRALRSQLVVTLPLRLLLQVPGLLQMVHCPHPPLVKSQGAGPFCSDVLGSMVSGMGILEKGWAGWKVNQFGWE
ncbi:hypothetical protein BHM03_00052203 [Ensete ventricosum]|nr:hypothetical protein BHM03_00052203 [Ensete ventricosum]